MKYVLFIMIAIFIPDTGKWSPDVETYVRYETGYDCKDGEKAVKAVVDTFASQGAKIRISTRCRERK
tara:strand:+ start:663 stop:863 length:201 start_codon:yes stop_codon:yes gene_type:complete